MSDTAGKTASPGGGALKGIGRFLYTFRGYIPAPALIAVILYARPSEISFLVGVGIVALGEGGRLWALTYIGPKSRAEGKRRADRLIMEGPYSLTRNPLYVANLTITAGILVATNRLILLAAVPLGVFYYYLVALAEEEFLSAEFPDQWEAFVRSVPRFFPHPAWPAKAEIRFGVLQILTPEMSTIIASEIALLIIGAKIFHGFFGFGGESLLLFPALS